jgi:hypothetical protein
MAGGHPEPDLSRGGPRVSPGAALRGGGWGRHQDFSVAAPWASERHLRKLGKTRFLLRKPAPPKINGVLAFWPQPVGLQGKPSWKPIGDGRSSLPKLRLLNTNLSPFHSVCETSIH